MRQAADLYFLRATVAFKLHKLPEVRAALASSPEMRESLPGRVLQADLSLQEGRIEEARAGYERLIEEERSWDNLARLAYLAGKTGDPEGAEELYTESADELTSKEMRHYAWIELQRGLLDLSRGRYDEARNHYETADKAYSGYWLVAEHKAELLGAMGEFDEAAALYEGVVGTLPRPEYQQALGELLMFMGKAQRAQPWLGKALNGYMASVRSGDVHYYHHLADFYADVCLDGAEAVRWARKDLSLRNNAWTRAAYAWALYRDGKVAEALEEISQALAEGAADAHTYFRAAEICRASGLINERNAHLQKAAEINPCHQNFHVHR
jgi:tetratricopeptide (TPR) repeat protein